MQAAMRDLTQREKSILGGAAASALLAFLPWLKVTFGGEDVQVGSANGFSGADGVLAFLAALATAGLVLADRAGALPWPARTRLLAPLASAGAALLCLIIYFGRSGGSMAGPVAVSRTLWFYLALAGMAFAAFQAFQRWTEGARPGGAGAAPPPFSPPPAGS
jgi:hypothetical protein